MKKTKRIVMAMLAIMLVCFLVMGVVFGKVKESNKGGQVVSGYIDQNGKFVQSYTGGGTLGGDREKESQSNTLSIVFYVLSGVTALGLAATAIGWRCRE